MKDLDTNFCKGEIERFYDLNGKEDDPKIALKKKDLIDTIYSFNPEFAESFVTLVGGDPARNRMGTLLKDQVNYRKFLDTVQDSNHTIDGGFSVANKKEYYLKSIQSLLADLNGNVKDIKLKKADDLWDWLKIGSICPFSESMSIYFFYLENLNRHYKKTPHANVILQGLFDSSILCSKLVKILSAKSSDTLRQTFSFYNLDDEVTDKYILDTSKSYEISEDKRSIVFRMLDGDMEDSSIMALTAITAEELQFVKENHLIS